MIPEGFEGTPREVIEKIHGEIAEKEKEISRLSAALTELAQEKKNLLFQIYTVLLERDRTYEIRKYVAFNKDSFYLVGWLPASSLKKAKQKIDKDPNVVIVVDSPREIGIKPPTKLKNFCLFRPFEMIVRMYGLPAYNELDPTPLVAILYCLLAGIMFGDVGQGLIFVLAGAILWFKKKSPLGGVFIGGGISAMIFGFLYGSIFSYEDVLEPIFMNPMEDANINTMLMLGIAVGVVLLVLCMVLNIINGIKAKDKGRVLFDRNGVAGLVFYTCLLYTSASGGDIYIRKHTGQVKNLDRTKNEFPVSSHCGIGHTRWATHGGVTNQNAHPHKAGRVTLIHNGIIENYHKLTMDYGMEGKLISDTDSEVAARLIDTFYDGDPVGAVYRAADCLEGSYAFCILFSDIPDEIFCIRRISPLVAAESEKGMLVSSDITALLPYTRRYFVVPEGVLIELSENEIRIIPESGDPEEPVMMEIGWDVESAQKAGYPFFMLKEIHEQPESILRTLRCV